MSSPMMPTPSEQLAIGAVAAVLLQFLAQPGLLRRLRHVVEKLHHSGLK